MESNQSSSNGLPDRPSGGFEWVESHAARASEALDRFGAAQRRTRDINAGTKVLLGQLDTILAGSPVSSNPSASREYGTTEGLIDQLGKLLERGAGTTTEASRERPQVTDRDIRRSESAPSNLRHSDRQTRRDDEPEI